MINGESDNRSEKMVNLFELVDLQPSHTHLAVRLCNHSMLYTEDSNAAVQRALVV